MSPFEPRLTPARPDLAAAHLQGQVAAERFIEGQVFQVAIAALPMRARPDEAATQETQLLFGETICVYEDKDGWAWGQAGLDGYVGYVESDALAAPVLAPTHRVAALRTYTFSTASLKSRPVHLLSLNAPVRVEAEEGRYAKLARSGWAVLEHLRPVAAAAPDWVATAETFLGAPYFWGGKESLGLDCSGLIQMAMHAAGLPCPRDSDMQEAQLGAALPMDVSALRRGDLVFWPGHVGVMVDETRLLHANGHHMAVTIEPLADAAARIAAVQAPIRSLKRLTP